MFKPELIAAAEALLAQSRINGWKLATAESCTGGLVSALLTEIPGSSDVFDRGFATYSNDAKSALLGVPADLITQHGAVSEQVARAMAAGALANSQADAAVAITGVAGPDGGTAEKPVGLVHLATSNRTGQTQHQALRLGNIGRHDVRMESVAAAVAMLSEAVST
ncbi:MAG: CinA family protein [Pseudomonadota bacterium]